MTKKANRLIEEESPYLLQHAYNPVDWFPWGEEAFSKAKRENKPIFLSIGYSSCHWCHVMEKESFEDDDVAKIINKHYIPVKVDKEERPEIDKEYMLVVQMFTGSGGWPMTLILTPDKDPFYADTYIPKTTKYGKLGLIDLLNQVKGLWKEGSHKIESTVSDFKRSLEQYKSRQVRTTNLDKFVFDVAYENLKSDYDDYFGGFGKRMKFPTIHNLLFLMRYAIANDDRKPLEMVNTTLINMSNGGIWDHIGFGFHRYSTDRKWLLPHFEKMLYDQAENSIAYLEAFNLSKDKRFLDTAEMTLDYVAREMVDKSGSFYTAEDADSEGIEGKFYTWSFEEFKNILDNREIEFMKSKFNIHPGGNFIDEASREKSKKNILHLKSSLDKNSIEVFSAIRKKLYDYREKRVKPLKDTKILTDWNSLMISAFIKAYRMTKDVKYLRIAKNAADKIMLKATDKEGDLLHLINERAKKVKANLDDYAFTVKSFLDIYEASGSEKYLVKALEFDSKQFEAFWDRDLSGYYYTSEESEKIIVRQKEIFDGAIPSGNSVSMENLMRLNSITGSAKYFERAEKLMKAFSSDIKSNPQNCTYMLCSMYYLYLDPMEIVICYDSDYNNGKDVIDIINKIDEVYFPNKVIIHKDISETKSKISEIAPFTEDMDLIDGKPTIYICSKKSCKSPTNDIDNIVELIKKDAEGRLKDAT